MVGGMAGTVVPAVKSVNYAIGVTGSESSGNRHVGCYPRRYPGNRSAGQINCSSPYSI
jgi:hypothetical protein